MQEIVCQPLGLCTGINGSICLGVYSHVRRILTKKITVAGEVLNMQKAHLLVSSFFFSFDLSVRGSATSVCVGGHIGQEVSRRSDKRSGAGTYHPCNMSQKGSGFL